MGEGMLQGASRPSPNLEDWAVAQQCKPQKLGGSYPSPCGSIKRLFWMREGLHVNSWRSPLIEESLFWNTKKKLLKCFMYRIYLGAWTTWEPRGYFFWEHPTLKALPHIKHKQCFIFFLQVGYRPKILKKKVRRFRIWNSHRGRREHFCFLK